jgi:uncharacterized protein (DUF697 family)
MTRLQTKRSRQIIHGAALAGAVVAGGLAQIPASDNAILVPIEILMVLGLGGVFRVPFRHSYRTSVIVGTAATMIGRGVSEVLVGWVPILGNILDAVTAVAVIEALGWVIVRDFNARVSQSPLEE